MNIKFKTTIAKTKRNKQQQRKQPGAGIPDMIVGHLTSIAFPTHGTLTKSLDPRVGMFDFLWDEMGPNHTCSHLGKRQKHGCFEGSHYFSSNNQLPLWILTFNLLMERQQYWLKIKGDYLPMIWKLDLILPIFRVLKWGFWPNILHKSQVPHICPGSPTSGLT